MPHKTEKPNKNIEEEGIKYVLLSARESDVKFIRLWFTDILGTLKGFAITVDELEGVLRNGASFEQETVCACRFVKLIGEDGWAE